jgi:hypothetical protein
MRDGCLAVEKIGRVVEVDSIVWSDIRHLKVVKHFSVKVRGQLEACEDLIMLFLSGVQAAEVHIAGCGGGSTWGHDDAARLFYCAI